jgi:hypothetical protein
MGVPFAFVICLGTGSLSDLGLIDRGGAGGELMFRSSSLRSPKSDRLLSPRLSRGVKTQAIEGDRFVSQLKKFYINGAWVDPIEPRSFDVVNPAT